MANTRLALQPCAQRIDLLPAFVEGSEAARVRACAGGVQVDGPASPWSHAALAPFALSGPATIVLQATVTAGRMSAGLVSADRSEISQEREFTAEAGQVIQFVIDDAAAYGGVLLRTREGGIPTILVTRLDMYLHNNLRYDVMGALVRQTGFVEQRRRPIEQALLDLEVAERFSPPQALTLAAVVADFKPSVILDLGTCTGGSAFSMALADSGVPIHTFDIETFWNTWVLPHVGQPPANITPVVADITQYDFKAILQNAERVMIFWDAHGFEIAGRVFSHIMPMIADKPHVVFCHDISDNRFNDGDESRSYAGKMMFRGYAHYDRNMPTTARGNLGWMTTAVDQGIALNDFCYRNRMTLCSVDDEVKVQSDLAVRQAFHDAIYPTGFPMFDLTYFTFNETYLRHFPSR